MTEITSLINSRVRLWKINHSGPGCRFYEGVGVYICRFYEGVGVYIINGNTYYYMAIHSYTWQYMDKW